MASVRDVITAWIASTAAGDFQLTAEVGSDIYDTIGPQDVNPSKYLISVPPRSLRNVMKMGGRIIEAVADPWLIKIVGYGKEFSELEAAYLRTHALFHRGGAPDVSPAPFPITVAGGQIIECYERDIISYQDNDAGVVSKHLGGLYFIAAKAD